MPAWRDLQDRARIGDLLSDTEALRQFLRKFEDFSDWRSAANKSRREQAAIALRNFQRSREDPKTFDEDKSAWITLNQKLTAISHHSEATEEKLRDLVDRLENLLLRYLRPGEARKLDAIEELVRSAGDSPTSHDLENVERLIDGFVDRDTFFRTIAAPVWIELLLLEGWFDIGTDHGPSLEDPIAGRSEVELLGRFAESAFDVVHAAAMKLASIEGGRVRAELLGLASKLPDEYFDAYLGLARSWAEQDLPYTFQRILSDFISRGLNVAHEDEMANFIAAVLRFQPDPRADEKRLERDEEGMLGILAVLDPNPRWDGYLYKEVLEKVVASTRAADRSSIVTVLCGLLAEGIDLSLWPGEKAQRNGNDGSTWWRPAIEPHGQNHDLGSREILVSAIRDLCELTIREDESGFDDVLCHLSSQHWLVFQRLRLHMFRQFPHLAGTQVRDAISDTILRDGHAWHEWALLLRQEFKNLPSEDQSIILKWIDVAFDATWRIDWFRQSNDGLDPDPELVEQWKGGWQFGKLSLIADDLDGEWKFKYESLRDRFKDPGHPEFHHWSESGGFSSWEETSPLKQEEIISSSPEELASRLNSWTEDREISEPTEWGLLSAVKSAAKSRPREFLSRIDEYRVLGARRFESVLIGCIEGAKEVGTIDWRILLWKVGESVREVIIPAARKEIAAGKRSTAGLDLVRAIKGLLSRDPLVLPVQYREEIWDCIRQLLNHPDPATDCDETSSPRDLSSTALNSCRLVAFGSVFKYVDWVRKGLGVTSPENPATEVLPILDERLRCESTLAGIGMFGQYLPRLMGVHRDWVEKRLGELFPNDIDHRSRRNAVWESFLTMTQPVVVGLDLLRGEYERAIQELTEPREESEARREGWNPEQSLVHHLCSFYWWGRIPLRVAGTLLDRFYSVAPIGMKRHMLDHMGRSLRSSEGNVSPEIQERFQEFMEFRLEVLGDKSVSQIDCSELRGFMKWVGSQKLPAKWTLETLLKVLELASSSAERDEFGVEDALSAYSNAEPDLAMRCLHKLAFSGDRVPNWFYETPIKTVLRRGLVSEDRTVKQMADEVQDALLREGRLGYRDLDSNDLTPEV